MLRARLPLPASFRAYLPPAMTASSVLLIVLALIGFFLLAAIVVVPVYRFLKREEQASRQWTRETLARRTRETPPHSNGTARHDVADEEKPGV